MTLFPLSLSLASLAQPILQEVEDPSTFVPNNTFVVKGGTYYVLQVEDKNGCFSRPTSVTVPNPPGIHLYLR